MSLRQLEVESRKAEPGPLADVHPLGAMAISCCEGFSICTGKASRQLSREGWMGKRGIEARRRRQSHKEKKQMHGNGLGKRGLRRQSEGGGKWAEMRSEPGTMALGRTSQQKVHFTAGNTI